MYVALLCLSLLSSHCTRNDPLAGGALQPAELRWVTLDVGSQVEQILAENFQSEHPEITFDRQPLSFNQDYFSGPPYPDILMLFANQTYQQASQANQLIDLGEVWRAATLDEQLVPNLQQLIRNRENGATPMLPVAFAWAAIYYNKEIFAQYNLQTPQTWDEFIQVCATLQANGERPLAMAGTNGTAYALWFDYLNLRLNGADYHRALIAGEERYDDPRVAGVLEIWRSLFEQGFVVERPEVMDDRSAINALVRGDDGLLSGEEAVMVLVDTATMSQIAPEFRAEMDFFRFPIIDPAIPLAETVDVIGYVVPAGAEYKAQAQSFLSYLGSREAQALIAREAAQINAVFAPVRVDLDEDAVSPEMNSAITMVQQADEVVPFTYQSMPTPLWNEFNRAFRILLSNKQDIQSFMNALETARQQAIADGAFP